MTETELRTLIDRALIDADILDGEPVPSTAAEARHNIIEVLVPRLREHMHVRPNDGNTQAP